MLNKNAVFMLLSLVVSSCNGMDDDGLPSYHPGLVEKISEISSSAGRLLRNDLEKNGLFEAHYEVMHLQATMHLWNEGIKVLGDPDGSRKARLDDFIKSFRDRVGYISDELLPAIDGLSGESQQVKKKCIDLIVATTNNSIDRANEYIEPKVERIKAEELSK